MTILTEDRLQITVTGEVSARKFDDKNHRLSRCMKAVDFIIEFDDHYMFIELKDPQHPNARESNQTEFIRSFRAGEIDKDLKRKYRDSLLYEWASGRADKPIDYYVLCAWDRLDSASLGRRTDKLKSILPGHGPDGNPWRMVRNCEVFNLDKWNKNLPQYPATRVSP